MVEVKLVLTDALEIQMLAQLQQALEIKRSQEGMRGYGVEPAPTEPAETPTSPSTEPPVTTHSAGTAVSERDDDAALDAPPYVDDVAVQRAITEYAQREGVPAAKDLLKSFGAQRVMDIKVEDRNRFVAATQPKVVA